MVSGRAPFPDRIAFASGDTEIPFVKSDIFRRAVAVSMARKWSFDGPSLGSKSDRGSPAFSRFLLNPGGLTIPIITDGNPKVNDGKQAYFTAPTVNPSMNRSRNRLY